MRFLALFGFCIMLSACNCSGFGSFNTSPDGDEFEVEIKTQQCSNPFSGIPGFYIGGS